MVFNGILNRLDQKVFVSLVFVSLGLVSCSSPAGQVAGTPIITSSSPTPMTQPSTSSNNLSTPAPTRSPGEQNLERIYPTLPEGLERMNTTQQAPIVGEVPADLLENILQDLASRQGFDPQQIEVIRAEAVTWPDGSLGCPQPGEYYTQEPVTGYWIILEVDATRFDYRTSNRSYFTLCEQPLPLSPPAQPDQ